MARTKPSADELKAYVDASPAVAAGDLNNHDARLRYLLGRRLVREDRYPEAAAYLSPPFDKILALYAKALADGANRKLPKIRRARAWFKAAWIARFNGMEIMGTEGVPDGFVSDGNFDPEDIAAQRLAGTYPATQYMKDGQAKVTNKPIVLKPTKLELERLARHQIAPNVRFHYRLIAGALAMRAASLLEDNTEELADVINTAGSWVKDRDEKVAKRYFQGLERRCAETALGRAAIARHWFVGDAGPWSTAESAAHEALMESFPEAEKAGN